jgi:uncharacterized DUF497 family protein
LYDYKWNEEKNKQLKKQRNITFEEIVTSILNEKVIDTIDNPSSNFDNQKCYIIEIDNYIWSIPFVKNGNEVFLKTAFPSRKHTKIYLNKD